MSVGKLERGVGDGWVEETYRLDEGSSRYRIYIARIADMTTFGHGLQPIANVYAGLAVLANFDSYPDDFLAYTWWKAAFAPATGYGVDIGAADTAAFDLDVNVVVFEVLDFELWEGSVLWLVWGSSGMEGNLRFAS